MVIVITLVLAPVASGTIWYFRNDDEVSYPVNAPTDHQTTDTVTQGTWQGRAMTLVNGTTSESYGQSITATGYWHGATFSSTSISPAQIFTAGQTWSVRIWAGRSSSGITVYPKIYIYEWHPGTGKGAVFLTPTQGGTSVPTTPAALTVSGSGAAGTLEASQYLCVDVYWNCSARTNTRTLTYYFGNSSYNSYLTSPGTEVPTLGTWLIVLAIALFVLFAIRKRSVTLKPVAMALSLILFVLMTCLPGPQQMPAGNPKPVVIVTVTDKSGKEIAQFPMKPVAKTDLINEAGSIK